MGCRSDRPWRADASTSRFDESFPPRPARTMLQPTRGRLLEWPSYAEMDHRCRHSLVRSSNPLRFTCSGRVPCGSNVLIGLASWGRLRYVFGLEFELTTGQASAPVV